MSDAAGLRILDVLADLERVVNEFDHLIYLSGTPTREASWLATALSDKSEEVYAQCKRLDRSVLTDARLLIDSALCGRLGNLAAVCRTSQPL